MSNPSRTPRHVATVRSGSPAGTSTTVARRRPTAPLVTALALLAVVTGCAAPPASPTATSPPDLPTVAASADPGNGASSVDAAPVAADHLAVIVRADDALEVHDRPGGAITHTLPAATELGSRRTLLVASVGPTDDPAAVDPTDDGWVEVHLPVRPNGTTGFVRRDEVTFDVTDLAVEIDLDARELRVLRGGEELLVAPTGIGDADHPTPTGTFFVTDKVATEDPDGPYGPYALGLSARSEVLTEFAGGDGQVGIHGTDAPASIGEAASKGCLRVGDEVVTELAHLLPLGTPVTIR